MHYANGRVAKLGDLVRGTGYKLKHEFTGVLIVIAPEATAYNATIATVTAASDFYVPAIPKKDGTGFQAIEFYPPEVTPVTEYSQLDYLVALDPNTGKVLLPEAV